MKITLLFIASVAYLVNAVPILDGLQDRPYQSLIEFPGGDGKMHVVDLEAEPDMKLIQEIERNPANNQYFLYTRRNPTSSQALIMNDVGSIHASNFNPSLPVIVVVHGWLSNQNTNINPVITKAYLDKSDVNVIIMDWRRLALSDYVTAVFGVPAVGRGLGQFLAFLSVATGASLDRMHLIGFSLGAHVVGNAGRELGGRAARVTGLDPAGPLWNVNSNRLNANDAVYVEAIHTDGNTVYGLGIGTAIAQVDFFPNGGSNQPGCLTGVCDHNRAWELFAATVTFNHLIGNECTSNLQITWNTCRGREFPMGNDDLRKSGSGMFRVNTGRRYPF